MKEIKTLSESALMQRLDQSPDDDVRDLAAKVRAIRKPAAALLSTVVKDMPLYTLHNERHILNVIGWMESLLANDQALSPLECALLILAAYSHDLGMTLSDDESLALPDDPDYRRFRDRFLEERQLIERLHSEGEHDRAQLIENHLRTEYLRSTHADRKAARLRRRLQQIAPDLVYRGLDYHRQLELVAISHNQPVEWLRLQFAKEGLRLRETVGNNEHVNFAFVGILLRLADIMDFDAGRTPTILFRHIGLEGELASRFAKISSQEWKKHLAITGIDWPTSDEILTYRSANCPHPVVEKSIREFVGMIQTEVSQAANELRHVGENQSGRILLPKVVRADITPARGHGEPAYTYHDWHFRLDQEEIIQLLMGESLYGDPALCIRELLQNALDAVELRDLRLRLRAAGGQPAQPVDGELVPDKPGWLILGGKREELAVRLTWGEENGRQFIRVEDNGTGMTKEVIERYFTQIGKSFWAVSDNFLCNDRSLSDIKDRKQFRKSFREVAETMSRYFTIIIFLFLLCFSSRTWAQDPKVVRQIEIRSSWSGFAGGSRADLLIQRVGESYLLDGKAVDADLVAALVNALSAPVNSKPIPEDLGITPAWLKENAASMAQRVSAGTVMNLPSALAALESRLADPAAVEKMVPYLFGGQHADDYPMVRVTVTFEDRTILAAMTGSPAPYLLPWSLHSNGIGTTGYNADISRAVAALMPEKAPNRARLARGNLDFSLAFIAMSQVAHEYQMLDVESKTGGAFEAIRSRYTIRFASIANYGDPVLREDKSGELNLHLLLKSPDLPDNFSDAVALEYRDGSVAGTDKFLQNGQKFEKLVWSVPWVKQYAQEHPKVSIQLSFFHGASFSDAAFRFFSADMRAIGRAELIPKLESMKDRIALLSIGSGAEESDWLVFPNGHMLLWRFYRVPRYGITSGLPGWPEAEYSTSPCAELRKAFVNCVGREATPDGGLVP